MNSENNLTKFSRRQVLQTSGAALLTSVLTPKLLLGSAQPVERSLHLHNTHTGEFFKDVYWAEGEFVNESLGRIDKVLCDHRTGETINMNKDLLNLLNTLTNQFGVTKALDVFSGFRSPKTNEKLRRQKRGVAKHSKHLTGHAVDFRIPGVRLTDLRNAARKLKAGGVGFYPRSGFVHVDIRDRPAIW